MKWERKDIKALFRGYDKSQWRIELEESQRFKIGTSVGFVQVREIVFTAQDILNCRVRLNGYRLTPKRHDLSEWEFCTVPLVGGVGWIPDEILKMIFEQAGRLMMAYEKAERDAAAAENGDHLKAVK